jgi:Xaa-Pro dipeptidase
MNRRHFLRNAGLVTAVGAVTPALSAEAFIPTGTGGKFPKELVKAMRDKIKPITQEERMKRIEQARLLMEQNGLDAIFMEGGTSLEYFSGARWGRSERLFGMLMTKKGDPVFIAPKFDESRAR